MAKFDYNRMARIADTLITKFGLKSAILRSVDGSAPDRPCMAAITDYRPKDQATRFDNPTDRTVFISPLDPDTRQPLAKPPNSETDVLVPLSGPDANKSLPF